MCIRIAHLSKVSEIKGKKKKVVKENKQNCETETAVGDCSLQHLAVPKLRAEQKCVLVLCCRWAPPR